MKTTSKAKWSGGPRITEFYKSLGLRRRAFSEKIGMSYDRILSYELGRTEPGPEFFNAVLARFPNADITWIISGIQTKTVKEMEVPIVASVTAGHLTVPFGDDTAAGENVLGWWKCGKKDPDMFALSVRGNSMYPEIQEEDLAFCAPNRPFLNGKIYAVNTVDQETTLKRVFRRTNGYDLVPTNQDYPTVFVPEEGMLQMVRVIEVVRKLN